MYLHMYKSNEILHKYRLPSNDICNLCKSTELFRNIIFLNKYNILFGANELLQYDKNGLKTITNTSTKNKLTNCNIWGRYYHNLRPYYQI